MKPQMYWCDLGSTCCSDWRLPYIAAEAALLSILPAAAWETVVTRTLCDYV